MGRKRLNLVAQRLRLERCFPESRSTINRNELCWRGTLRPTELSRDYVAKVTYKLGGAPHVWILHPKLEKRNDQRLPHVYEGDRLCLYLPGTGEWTETQSLAHTIVPWTSEWLLHYELWLVTGDWNGGGEHPQFPR